MKVVQINAIYEKASTGRTVKEEHEYLLEHNIDSYVFVGKLNKCYKNVYEIGNEFERKMHGLFSRIFGLQGYYSKIATKRLIKIMNKINPDVVQLRNLHGNYINLNILLNYLAEKNIITFIQLHDCWFFTGRCVYYTKTNCKELENGCEKCIKNYIGNPSWFFDRAQKMYNDKEKLFNSINNLYVVGVSRWIMEESKKSFFNKNVHFSYQYNWIDLNLFKPKKIYVSNERPIILSIASEWVSEKGIYDIKEIAAKLPEYDFVIIGNQKYKLQFSKNVKLISNTNSINKLIMYYQSADLFLNLSVQETFGKVTAESLSCGTPVVAYNTTATPELIGQGCGYLSDVGDIDSVIENIKKILSKGKRFYSGKARKYAIEHFDKEKILDSWIQLFENAIKKRK